MVNNLERKVTCYFCFEDFEVDLLVQEDFSGHNVEFYDCSICCNPNKLSYEVYDGEIASLVISDGNE